jgi:SAM-dependent methyltransferase
MPSFLSEPVRGRQCPNCGGPSLTAFYEARGVPVQSNLLMPTREEALACPTGELRLAFCRDCTFITNTAFDPATQELTARYEATQGFSPTFNAFARSLARRWAERYSLAGKHALEIGCGRGEFISLLCEAGGCQGIGIDPIADPKAAPAGGRVRLIADYYSPAYAHLPADFICCRHTLEHIADPGSFVRMVRDAIGDRTGTVVAFEVPDTLRVLAEGAFWDLYYEHCSYFTPGSLAAVFRQSGFATLDLRSEYGGQYLVLEATPAPAPTERAPAENENEQVCAAVEGFRIACGQQLEQWGRVLGEAASSGRRVVVWGSGSKAVGFLTSLGVKHDAVAYVVDINPHKQDTFLPGGAQQIVAPEKLRDYRPDTVIAMNPVYREEIAADLRRLGVGAQLLTL